jgi:hypothetical protein
MLDSLTSASAGDITFASYLLCVGCALLCGLIVACASSLRTGAGKSLFLSETLLPPIVATVIIIVNGSIGTGIAVAGAFSLIRFRSAPGKARDMAALFLSMAAGIVCASGYLGIALLFTVAVSAVILLFSYIRFGAELDMDLRITVPESLGFADAFTDIFSRYTSSWRLVTVKTSNMGSMYRLQYRVRLRDRASTQAFIDEIRTRNANLEVSLSESSEREDGGEL